MCLRNIIRTGRFDKFKKTCATTTTIQNDDLNSDSKSQEIFIPSTSFTSLQDVKILYLRLIQLPTPCNVATVKYLKPKYVYVIFLGNVLISYTFR